MVQQVLQHLYSSASVATANPAVTTRNVGTNGGKAVAFTYDLARSIVYTRQGDPTKAGVETDGQSPIRPDDMFFPSYIDLNKVAIPQADEQQRLLANIIIQSNLARNRFQDSGTCQAVTKLPSSMPSMIMVLLQAHLIYLTK